jgi:hypothetical protein
MWYPIEKPKVVQSSPKLAETFRDMLACPYDRPTRQPRLDYLREVILNGTFRNCEWATAYCEETGLTYRVNGKHTSTIVSGLNGEAPPLNVVLGKYHCDTLEDVAKLYATFDTRSSMRSTNDIYLAYACAVPQLAGLSGKTISVAVAGMAYHYWTERSYLDHPAEEKAELLWKHRDFVLFYHQLIFGHASRHLKRSPAAAAMFSTYLKCQRDAKLFWELVMTEEGASPRTPDRKLADYLKSVCVNLGVGSRTTKKVSSVREIYAKCIHAWNAWRTGASTDLKYYANVALPKPV